MATCPQCQSNNVVITEEVFTRKGRVYYRFLQTILVVLIMVIGFVLNELLTAFFIALLASVIIGIFSLVNASKRAISKTKLVCLSCQHKRYL